MGSYRNHAKGLLPSCRAPHLSHLRVSTIASVFASKASPKSAEQPGLYDTMAKVSQLRKAIESMQQSVLDPKRFTGDVGERVGFICQADVQQGGVRASQ